MTIAPTPGGFRWALRVLVALGCFLLGLVVLAAVWSLTYPEPSAIPDYDVGRVGAAMLADVALGAVGCALLPIVLRGPRPSRPQPQPRSTTLVTPSRATHGLRSEWLASLAIIAATAVSTTAAPAFLVALGAVASWRRTRELAVACLVAAGSFVAAEAVNPQVAVGLPALLGAALALIATPVVIGLYLGSRRALLDSYRREAEGARREAEGARREAEALLAQARYAERTRIAREMHDTLSQRLALISLHAGALSYRADADPSQVADGARLIQQTAQTASEDLHALLTLLREDSHDASLDPTLHDLETLLERARRGGVHVTLDVDGDLRARWADLGGRGSRALACVVAEGLANTLKHAPGRPVTVAFAEADGGLRLTLTNALDETVTPLPGGFGLVGLRERLAVAGGRLDATRDATGFRLTAWVPWRRIE